MLSLEIGEGKGQFRTCWGIIRILHFLSFIYEKQDNKWTRHLHDKSKTAQTIIGPGEIGMGVRWKCVRNFNLKCQNKGKNNINANSYSNWTHICWCPVCVSLCCDCHNEPPSTSSLAPRSSLLFLQLLIFFLLDVTITWYSDITSCSSVWKSHKIFAWSFSTSVGAVTLEFPCYT